MKRWLRKLSKSLSDTEIRRRTGRLLCRCHLHAWRDCVQFRYCVRPHCCAQERIDPPSRGPHAWGW